MVVKMMRWRPWPPLVSRKYEVKVVVKRLEGYSNGQSQSQSSPDNLVHEGAEKERCGEVRSAAVEIRWKGQKAALRSFRRSVWRRDLTKEAVAVAVGENDGVFVWDEEFRCVCNLSAYKDNSSVFLPWEVGFTILDGSKQGAKSKVAVIGTASLNIAEFTAATEKEHELNIHLSLLGSNSEASPFLSLALSILELKTPQDTAESVQKSIVTATSSPASGATSSASEKDELSALKAGLRKVKILTEYVASRRVKKACRDEGSSRSDDGDCMYPFDSDTVDEFEEGEADEGKGDHNVRKSFSYGTLAYANYAGGIPSGARINGDDEDWVYYSNRRSDVGCSTAEDSSVSTADLPPVQYSRRSILPWKKRKLNYRSPKGKGEPLLKKAYAEEGGDDIDFDRRQLSSDESFMWHKSDEDSSGCPFSVSEFGEDNFAVGSWEPKEIISRDGHMKLQTEVFFASIDQRSERAAGESACTALVAVIADWLDSNRDIMPNKSQFDCLIREGSLEWRHLCGNETYRERFPDKHFDLETVLQAKIRPLLVDPGKSFIGFFHPDGMDEDRFEFLQGSMSFDGIWDEISSVGSHHNDNIDPRVYIVSWNDHFFILKVEEEAYYVIDTLGERLHEGCSQAYILKFDKSTKIFKLPSTSESPDAKAPGGDNKMAAQTPQPSDTELEDEEEKEEVVCQGKESCKEYIKSFLAAIPIRELLADLKKGLMASTPIHHRLQIEFQYTQFSSPAGARVSNPTGRPIEIAMTEDGA